MPYTIRKNAPGCPESKPYAVVKTTDGKVMGCHESSIKAGAQIGAIEADEKALASQGENMPTEDAQGREGTAESSTTNTMTIDPRTHETVIEQAPTGDTKKSKLKEMREKGYVPWEAMSFNELDSYREAKKVADAQYSVLSDFQLLQENIIYSDDIEDKAGAIAALAAELPGRMKDAQSKMDEKSAPTDEDIDAITTMADKSRSGTGLTIEKQADGTYRWLAVYSNKYRDRDYPPEIISEESHLTFIKAVESGAVEYPELWLWHVPGTRIGQADFLTYADGFAIGGGTIDPEHTDKARKLSQFPNLGVSHGMPHWSIKRRADDSSVIDRHITREISPLEMDAAANALTGFILEDKNMASIKQSQLEFLRQLGYSDEAIANLGKTVESKAAQAQELKLESKEQEDEAEAPEEEGAVLEDESQEDAASEDKAADEEEVTEAPELKNEVAQAMVQMVQGFNEVVGELTATIQGLQKDLTETKDRLGKMERSDSEKIAEKAADTPQASLASMVYNSIVGKEGARVDGREKYAKDGPEEAQADERTGPFFKEWTRS